MALTFLKKGTSHNNIITYLAMKRKETSHKCTKKSLTAKTPLERNG